MGKVETYIEKKSGWQKELEFLRAILLETELVETTKWGSPIYSFNGKNVVGIAAFKSYVGLWFFQGVFLKDEKKLLVNAQEGVTKALRQMRFSSIEEMDKESIKSYILEAIENQKAGKELKPEKKKLVIPKALQAAFDQDKTLADSFDKLTSGKQKEYANHIANAKQAKTKQKRLDKIIPMVKKGIGLNDKYKNN
jgi:uncharacterized protein YdeI (YjbR/CyaY-like superfamily)